MDDNRAFAVASDDNPIALIKHVQRRLIVVCPALTDRVADALADRLADEGKIGLNVILDADPEVYRLGYGTEAALDRLRAAAARNLFDLRVQRGVRIGVVISDDGRWSFPRFPSLSKRDRRQRRSRTQWSCLAGQPTGWLRPPAPVAPITQRRRRSADSR